MKKTIIIFMLFICALLWGCASGLKPIQEDALPYAAYTVVDDAGRKLSFERKPTRIVSLTYGTDEILVDLVDLKRIRAFSRWAGDKEISFITREQLIDVGLKVNDNLEAILKLEPDVVVASAATSYDVVQSLENIGIKVYIASSPRNYEGMCRKIEHLAQAVGEADKGKALVEAMNLRMQQLEQRLSKLPDQERKVAVEIKFTSVIGPRWHLLAHMLY